MTEPRPLEQLDPEQRAFVERVTLHETLPTRLALAAHLGHPEAQAALLAWREAEDFAEELGLRPEPRVEGKYAGRYAWGEPGLFGYGGRAACVEAAVAAAELVADRLREAALAAPLRALGAAEAWLADRERPRSEEAEAAAEDALATADALARGKHPLLERLREEALARRRREGRPPPAADAVAPTLGPSLATAEAEALASAARACALAAWIVALPLPGQSAETGDPELLLRVAQGEVARLVGREAVEAAVRARLLPATLGELDPPELREQVRQAREVVRRLGRRTLEARPSEQLLRDVAGRHWEEADGQACAGHRQRRSFGRTVPDGIDQMLGTFAFLGALGLLIPLGVWLDAQARVPELPRIGAGLIALLACYLLLHGLARIPLRWRYAAVSLDPATLTFTLSDEFRSERARVHLDQVVSWRPFLGGVLVRVRGRGWLRGLLDPLYLPTPTAEFRTAVERFLRGEARALLRERRRP
ncbi:MAG: hypothetical protein AB7N76_09375 [Planctomycetota bacterium]